MSKEINLVSLIRLFINKIIWIIIVGLIFSGSLALYYHFIENRQNYIVNSTIRILPKVSAFEGSADSVNLQLAIYNASLVDIYEMARSDKISRSSISSAGLDNSVLRDWNENVLIKYLGDSGLLEISVRLDEVEKSNALIEALIVNIQNGILENYPLVQSDIYEAPIQDLFSGVQQEASKLQLILSFIIGIIIACVAIYFIDYFNQKIKTVDDLIEVSGSTLIAKIKKKTEYESARLIQILMTKLSPESGARSFQFLSIVDDKSKLRLLKNLAESFSAQGNRVLLVDADMHNFTLTKELISTPQNGLFNILKESGKVKESYIVKSSAGFDFLPSGINDDDSKSSDLLVSDTFRNLIKSLSSKYDYILVNSCSLDWSSGAEIISTVVDTNIITVQQDKVTFLKMADTMRSFEKLKSSVAGIIFTDTY